MIQFVIINYNTGNLTCDCIESIYRTYNNNAKIIVVDNASNDNSVDLIKSKYPDVLIIQNEINYGYAKAVNIGMKSTTSELVIVCNSDVVFHEGSINITEEILIKNSDIGVSGFQQFYPDGSIQRSYGMLPGWKLGLFDMLLISTFIKRFINNSPSKKEYIEVEYADGAALLIRKSIFDLICGFDEHYFFYTEEADYCKMVSDLAYKVVIIPNAHITHIRGASSGNSDFNVSSERMLIKTKIQYLDKHKSKLETKFFIFSQFVYFYLIFILSKCLSIVMKNKFPKSIISKYYQISKLWLNAESK
jgi:GT2 family glycosyltransferase